MFGRKLKSSIAEDNGRSTEFIRKKVYTDKTQCYECGETGHLSYKCPKNALGERDPPPKKIRKRKKDKANGTTDLSYYDSSSSDDEPVKKIVKDVGEEYEDLETLSAAIALEVMWSACPYGIQVSI